MEQTDSKRHWATRHLIHPVATGLVLAGLASVCLFTALRSLKWPLALDTPPFHYIGWRILSGDMPYRDIFDINMPGTYLIHTFVVGALGSSDLAWRFFDLSWLLLTALAAALLASSSGRWAAVITGLLVSILHISGGPDTVGERDFIICLFLILAAHLVVRSVEQKNSFRHLLLAGVFLGTASIVKPFAGVFWILLAGLHVWANWAKLRACLTGLAALFFGALITPLATFTWLAAKGALLPFWSILTGYTIPLYSKFARGSVPSLGICLMKPTRDLAISLVFPLIPLIGLRNGLTPRYVVAFLGVIYGFAHFLLQGKCYFYHLYPFFCFLIILSGMILGDLLASPSRRYQGLAVICLALLCLNLGNKALKDPEYLYLMPDLVKDISTYSLSGQDTIQLMDTVEGGHYALYALKIPLTTRFLYDFFFFNEVNHPITRRLRAEFLRELKDHPPKLIIFFSKSCCVYPNPGSRLSLFPEFNTYLNNNYILDKVRDDYSIYLQRKDGASILQPPQNLKHRG